MESLRLEAKKRILRGRKTDALRDEGWIPAVIYGVGQPVVMVSIPRQEFSSIYKKGGESTLVYLEMADQVPETVLIQDYQIDPLYQLVTHVDFRRVDMNKPVEAEMQLRFVGEAPAVRELGGILVHAHEHIDIRALPKDLVRAVDVDLSSLKTFEDVIRLSDIVLPEGITALTDLHETIVTVIPPRTEEEIAALNAAVEEDVSSIESAKKKKPVEDDGEAGKEGKPEAKKAEGKKSDKK